MLRLFGIIEINALKIAEKALATLGAFSTILRALMSIIPQNVTLMRYQNSLYVFSRAIRGQDNALRPTSRCKHKNGLTGMSIKVVSAREFM